MTEVQIILERGMQAQRSGEPAAAERYYREVLRRQPDQPDALHYLGVLALEAGYIKEAADLIGRALKHQRKNPYLWRNLGETRRLLGQLDQAVEACRKALKLKPDFIEARGTLALALQAQGRLDDAVTEHKRVLKLDPNSHLAYINMGNIAVLKTDYETALAYYQQAITLSPESAEAYHQLGNLFIDWRRWDEAERSLKTALRLAPDKVEILVNLGVALAGMGETHAAIAAYSEAIERVPTLGIGYFGRGNVYRARGDLDEAEVDFIKAIELNGSSVATMHNLGSLFLDKGEIEQARRLYRDALTKEPGFQRTSRSLLLADLYDANLGLDSLFDSHRSFAQRHATTSFQGAFQNTPDPKRRIRIAYLSSDLRSHPVGYNIAPLIQSHDRDRFEIFFYAHVKKPDSMADWFRKQADAWRSVLALSDEELARLIRRDKIDILIVLAGRFDENRPLVAAYRAAPIQVSMHDPATSGLDQMDYLVADRHLIPKDTGEKFTERVIRLPTFFLHAPLIHVPEVSCLPAKHAGSITFGSFNNPAKLNEKVVALWSKVLKAVPNACLLLKYRAMFSVPSVRAKYLALFERQGIPADRLILAGEAEGRSEHLSRYEQIDIALDTFPFTGSTTTFEALWMGVPVVTLMGDRMVARWSGAMLKKLKLDELIAHSETEYVEIAEGLAQNLDQLASLRASLRERVAQSPLCDEKRRTYQLERAFRWMWAKWCADHRN